MDTQTLTGTKINLLHGLMLSTFTNLTGLLTTLNSLLMETLLDVSMLEMVSGRREDSETLEWATHGKEQVTWLPSINSSISS